MEFYFNLGETIMLMKTKEEYMNDMKEKLDSEYSTDDSFCVLNQEHLVLMDKYNLSEPQIRQAVQQWIKICCLMFLGLWKDPDQRRLMTRELYLGTISINTGYKSVATQNNDSSENTYDHAVPPQLYASFVFDNWEKYEDNFKEYLKMWLFISQTIYVTKKQNTDLSKFSVNNKSTNNQLKTAVSLADKYDYMGIDLLNVNSDSGLNSFPIVFSKEFLKYERENLLDVSLVDDVLLKLKTISKEKLKEHQEYEFEGLNGTY
tara:strand:- start:481 stop:1263 length:783 start_codon:yes stop_codon:yes gene_type:complete